MVTVVATLLLLSFLEGSVLPFSLVFMILICRAFVVPERSNFYLAFWFGLLLSLLLGFPLGSLSLFYLLIILLIGFIRKAQFSANWLAAWPLAFVLLGFHQLAVSFFSGISLTYAFRWQTLLVEEVMILPVYFIVRFWEERFVPKREIRLKVGK